MGVSNNDEEKVLGQTPESEDAAEAEIEGRMKAWSEPIADAILAEAAAGKIPLEIQGCPEPDRREMLTTVIGGLAAVQIGASLKGMLPRAQQEAGDGRLRFKRDATGELCVTIDGAVLPMRMSVREAYVTTLLAYGLPLALADGAAKRAEEAFLAGTAWMLSFTYDAKASAPEEAVYARSPFPGEVEEERRRWTQHDSTQASLEALRRKRVAKLAADVEALAPGTLASRLLKLGDGVTVDDLEFALGLLENQMRLFLGDARFEKPRGSRDRAVLLRRDASVRGAQEIPASYLRDQLNDDFGEIIPRHASGRPVTISPAGVIMFAVEIGARIPDLFKGLRCVPDPDGLRVTYAPPAPNP